MIFQKDHPERGFLGDKIYELPSEDEIRYIAKTNDECLYYVIGMDECRNQILGKIKRENPDETVVKNGFLPCKQVTDNYFRCMTFDKYGKTAELIEDVQAKEYLRNFQKCYWKDLGVFGYCRKFHDDVIRKLYREEGSPLQKYHK